MMISISIALFISLVVSIVIIRNRLIRARNLVQTALADIDAYLLKRHELIPRLVQLAHTYSVYETDTLVKMVETRKDQNTVTAQLTSTFQLIKENYPNLQADGQYEQLMEAIQTTEDHLLFARRFYNGTVEAYNRMLATIPYSFLSSFLGHRAQQYISANEQQQQLPIHD
jgi:LemA protein